MDQEITHDIKVAVQSFYLDNESDPEKPLFLFAYRVRIENQGYETVQLLKRHWIITDGDGQIRHVEGEGVVGESPSSSPENPLNTQVVAPCRLPWVQCVVAIRCRPPTVLCSRSKFLNSRWLFPAPSTNPLC